MSKLKLFLAMVAFVATLPVATEALAVPDHCRDGFIACLGEAQTPGERQGCVDAYEACGNY